MKKLNFNLILFVFISAAVSAQNVGIGQASPRSKLDINGGVTIGSTYSGTNAAPTNGAIIQGQVGIGNNNPKTGAILDLSNSSGLGFVLPTVTSTPASPATGMMVYNTTTGCLQYYNGSVWVNIVTPNSTSPTWVTNPATICTSQNTSYVFNSVSGASYQVTFTGSGNTVNGTNATVTALTVTASAATTTLTISAATSGTLTVTLNGCTGNSVSLTQSITAGYGTIALDASIPQAGSGTITTNHPNEIILFEIEQYRGGSHFPVTFNGSSVSANASVSYQGSASHCCFFEDFYYFVVPSQGNYSYSYSTSGGDYWNSSGMSVYNTCGNALTASNIHLPAISTATAGSITVTSGSTVVPAGSYLGAATVIDGGSGSGTVSFSSSTSTVATVISETDGDSDSDGFGGGVVTTAAIQSITGTSNNQSGGASIMQMFWVQYP